MKLSQWHDGNVKPVHVGVYDVCNYYSYWDGLSFKGHWDTIEKAYKNKDFFHGSTTQFWRGIVKDKK